MAKLFDVKLVFEEIPDLLGYLPTTVILTLTAMVIGIALGLIIAIVKINRSRDCLRSEAFSSQ